MIFAKFLLATKS